MSLSRLVMRIAAARALRGATLAEARVFDSAVDPIDQAIAENRAPLLVVTTDDHEVDITGRDLMHGEASCDLVIEAAIASRVEVTSPDGEGGEVTIAIPHTDEGMELVLDMIEHQVMLALTSERSDWSRIWMNFVPRIIKRASRRGASVEHGVRFAARQIVFTCDLIDTPASGAAISEGSVWADVLAVMEADGPLSPIATMLRSEIEGQPLADWRRAANMLGIHVTTAQGIGIAPMVETEEEAAVVEALEIVAELGADMIVSDQAAGEQGYNSNNA